MGQRQSSTNDSNSDSGTTPSPPNVEKSSSSVSSASDAGRPLASTPLPSVGSNRRSRRASVCKSILGLIRPDTSSRVGGHTAPSSDTQDRKHWRKSRRWSKAPISPQTVQDSVSGIGAVAADSVQGQPQEQGHSGTLEKECSTVTLAAESPENAVLSQPGSDTINECSPTTQPAFLGPSSLNEQAEHRSSSAEPYPQLRSVPVHGTENSVNIGDELDGQESTSIDGLARFGRISDQETSLGTSNSVAQGILAPSPDANSHASSASTSTNSRSDAQPSTSQEEQLPQLPPQERLLPSHQQQQQQQHTRQFPPPGTLVVVQGVVHTTDTPREPVPATSSVTTLSTPVDANADPVTSGNTSTLSSEVAASMTTSEGGSMLRPQHRSRTPVPGQRNALLQALLRRRSSSPAVTSDINRAALGSASSDSNLSSSPQIEDTGTYVDSTAADLHREEGVSSPASPTATSVSSASPSVPIQTMDVQALGSTSTNNNNNIARQGQVRRPGQLSANSIDVLGTLLSIATAATAASLVSGSTDALFRTPHPNSPSTQRTGPLPLNSSTSPVMPTGVNTESAAPATTPLPPSPALGLAIPAIARALAAANPGAAAAVAQRERERAREREREDLERNRVRSIWEGLRDRLGHSRGRGNSHSTAGAVNVADTQSPTGAREGPPSSAGSAETATNGPGERLSLDEGGNGLAPETLFNEIARAFNLGLRGPPPGVLQQQETQIRDPTAVNNEEGGSSSSSGEHRTEERSGESMPPDSFERFLVDLQTDLRIALLRMDSGNEADSIITNVAAASTPAQESSVQPTGDEVEANLTLLNAEPGLTGTVTMVENMHSPSGGIADSGPVVESGTEQSSTGINSSETRSLVGAVNLGRSPVASSEVHPVTVPETIVAASSHRSEDEENGDTLSSESISDVQSDEEFMEFQDAVENVGGGISHPRQEITTPPQPTTSSSDVIESSPPETSMRGRPDTDPSHTSNGSNGIANNPRGGINWWRMYRFPPMRINPSGQTNARATGQAATSTAHSTPATHNNPTPLQSEPVSAPSPAAIGPTQHVDPTLHPPPSAPPQQQPTDQNANLVVPVIVVGLQSISIEPRVGTVSPTNGVGLSSSPTAASAQDQPGQVRPSGDTLTRPDAPELPSNRNWQARAARAISRIGRRAGDNNANETGDDEQDNPGSRTFFIYVFGGYYPPNHHIVTGSGNLDSFEALWELAELLGQAKPPVATQDEIEKSGLEIFKASALSDYETNGKVASSCVDRCLVCLDDYEPDDDLRMMSCKHAFHKTCVDRWLQTGRNNCPACRGQGANTSGGASPTST